MEVVFTDKSTKFEAVGVFSQVYLNSGLGKSVTVFLEVQEEIEELADHDDIGLGLFDEQEVEKVVEELVVVKQEQKCFDLFSEEIELMKLMGLPLSFGNVKESEIYKKGRNKKKKNRGKAKKTSHSVIDYYEVCDKASWSDCHMKKSKPTRSSLDLTERCNFEVNLLTAIFWEQLLKPKLEYLCDIAFDKDTFTIPLLYYLLNGYQFPPLKLCPTHVEEMFLEQILQKHFEPSSLPKQRVINLIFDTKHLKECFIETLISKCEVEKVQDSLDSNSFYDEVNSLEEFNNFWNENGYTIVSASWALKYSDYMIRENDTNDSCEVKTSAEESNTDLIDPTELNSNNDYDSMWQDLWNEHWCLVYEDEKDKFFQNLYVSVPSGQAEENKQPQEKDNQNGSADVQTNTNNRIAPFSAANSFKNGASSDDDPPEERPIHFKRSHENDSEENADLSFHFKRAGLAVQTSDDNLPVPVKIINNKKLKKTTDDANREDLSNYNPNVEGSSKKNKKSKPINTKGMPEEMLENPELKKYWAQRYRLFSRFDKGIKLDAESWYSVTPERISKHIAQRCRSDYIIDGFCGAGGNTIQFASSCQHVLAIDIDPLKIELARHNATVYGVAHKIEFVVGDFMELAKGLRADVIFVSMPWGGPEYLEAETFDLNNTTPNCFHIMEVCRKITKNIALFVPRNSNNNQLVQMAGHGNKVEVEQNILDRKVKTITAYYGDLVKDR